MTDLLRVLADRITRTFRMPGATRAIAFNI